MRLESQLTSLGLGAAAATALALWAVSVILGRLLLGLRGRSLGTLAASGAWGFAFIVASAAAFKSNGTTVLILVPLCQLLLAIQARMGRARQPGSSADDAIRGPAASEVLAAFAAALVAAQCIYLWGIMPPRSSGGWQVPFEDYTWWGALSARLNETGVESLSIATLLALDERGAPQLHWYHWLEFWAAGLSSALLGANAFLVLVFVVYPMLVAMCALCSVAIITGLAGWKRRNWLLGLGVLVAMPVPTRWLMSQVFASGTSLYPLLSHPLVYYANYHATVLFLLLAGLLLIEGRRVAALVSFGIAMLCGPPLLPLMLVAIPLTMLHEAAYRLRGPGIGVSLHAAGAALGATLALYLWILASRHSGPFGYDPLDLAYTYATDAEQVASSVRNAIAALVVGFPYLAGLYWLWTHASAETDRHASAVRLCVLFGFYCLVGSSFAHAILARANPDAMHIPAIAWSGFVIPLGWAGLCMLLAQSRPAIRAATAACMLVLAGAGAWNLVKLFRTELSSRPEETFSASEMAAVAATCAGKPVGYFSSPGVRERVWWHPYESLYTALAGCRLMRLNSAAVDKDGKGRDFWRLGGPMQYARRAGIEWQDSPDQILGFAKANGVLTIVESARHPIPGEVRERLQPEGRAGPLLFWKIAK